MGARRNANACRYQQTRDDLFGPYTTWVLQGAAGPSNGFSDVCKDWRRDNVQPSEAEGFFLALLSACAELASKSVDVKQPFAADGALQKAVEMTEARPGEAVISAEVASAVTLSERSMQRRFARDVGMTWSQVFARLRMIHALELLSVEDLSVIEVAGDCGFNSLSAFNRVFLQFAKCTPTEFRKGLQGQ